MSEHLSDTVRDAGYDAVGNIVTDALLWPAIFIGITAFFVPRLLGKVLPEGVKPLLLNAFVSTLVLFVVTAALFFLLYLWQGAEMAELLAGGLAANVVFFGKLGLAAAIIWAPIMILSLAGLPRKWVHETW